MRPQNVWYYSPLVRIRGFIRGSRSRRCIIDTPLNKVCLPKAFFVFFQSLFNISRFSFDYLYAIYAEIFVSPKILYCRLTLSGWTFYNFLFFTCNILKNFYCELLTLKISYRDNLWLDIAF